MDAAQQQEPGLVGSVIPPGWVVRPGKAFNTFVGPFYQREDGDESRCGFATDERHGNKRGVCHGGMIATAFDVALGNAGWAASGGKPCATISLNVQFIGALHLHEFAEIAIETLRATRTLVFLRGRMTVGERLVASADGVWKVLAWRGETPATP